MCVGGGVQSASFIRIKQESDVKEGKNTNFNIYISIFITLTAAFPCVFYFFIFFVYTVNRGVLTELVENRVVS